MSEAVYTPIGKEGHDHEKHPLTSNHSPVNLHGISKDQALNSLGEEEAMVGDIFHPNTAVTSEPHQIKDNPHPSSWSSLSTSGRYHTLNDSSLVILESDDEDESLLTSTPATSAKHVNKQLALQLAKDGYELDKVPDNDQIDLIPPTGIAHVPACTCCDAVGISCSIS